MSEKMNDGDEKKKNAKRSGKCMHKSERIDDETVENEKMNDEMVKNEKGDGVKKKRNSSSTSPGFKYRPNTLRRQQAVRRPNGIATQLTDSQLETNLRTTHVFTFDGKLSRVKISFLKR